MPHRRQPAPTLRLRRLAAELRNLRVAAGLTREEIAERTGINGATLYRIESGRARPQMRTLVALLELYGVTEPERGELLALSRNSSEHSWLQSFPSELPDAYATYITFEAEARSLLNYESLFIPGLLQTEDYARVALQRGNPTATKEEIQHLVEARMNRQALLARNPPLRLWTIIDEAALRRPVGGHSVIGAQLEHLAESAELPHVTLQVLPYEVGGHPGMAGAFAILQFDDPFANDVVYIESQAGDLFIESKDGITRFSAIFEHLRALALPPDGSVSFITGIAGE
jgi:transcriptional regulator with XRE-family HTH domain